ncbi:hypothetical protein [uncultured Dokdonia sp.]|uniref:hypothetical protein n=1 Tax=uncultured Dokdonia sp. TaxID=575653 RepID=UPI002632706C|nr:hypothetical protein [uncultured Dokdonia sp.]
MKNFFKFLTITLLAVTVSCSSDDDAGSSVDNNSIEGTFRLTSFVTQTSYDLDGDGDSSNDLLIETDCYQNQTLTFNEGNNGFFTSTSFLNISVDVEIINGDETYTQTVNCETENDITSFTWQRNGDGVIISTGSQNGAISSDFNSDGSLTFTISQGFIAEIVEGEGTATVTEDVVATYVRI